MNLSTMLAATDMPPVLIGAITFVIIVFVTVMAIARLYKRCPSDRILVIYGKVKDNKSSRCIHGGGAFIVPLVQDYAYLSLTPMTISIPLQGALSFQNIRINVPSTFTVGVSTEPAIMMNAAERLLALPPAIEDMAKEIIFASSAHCGLAHHRTDQPGRESCIEIRRTSSPNQQGRPDPDQRQHHDTDVELHRASARKPLPRPSTRRRSSSPTDQDRQHGERTTTAK